MSILDTMKKIAEQSQNAAVPAAFLFAQVTAVSPLVVRVDNRFDLPASALVVLKETDGDPLAVGDKLALLRNHGGSRSWFWERCDIYGFNSWAERRYA